MDDVTAIDWVTVERDNGSFIQATSHPVLHRATCRHVKRANSENVFEMFDGPQTEAWVWDNGSGFDRACQTCLKGW